MAYLLRFSGGEKVSIPSIGISNSVGFKITVDASFGGFSSTFLPILGRSGTSGQRVMFSGTSASDITGLRFGGSAANTIPSFDWSTRKTVSIESTATTIIVKIDGVLHAEVTRSIDYTATPLNELFISTINTISSGDIYSVTIETGGVLTRDYDPSASNGTGQTLIDTIGGNNGTLVGFPTNNTQWIRTDAVTRAGSRYLKWPADSGSVSTNKSLCQISGITGVLSTVRYTLAENMPAFLSRVRYIFDIRRLVNNLSMGAGANYIYQLGATNTNGAGTSDHKINGSSVAVSALFGVVAANSVCEFNVNATPSGGCIAFGARFNETEHAYELAVKNIEIVDANGTHTINMSDSGGTLNEFTSDTGNLTLKLFNFPVNNSQWILYNSITQTQPLTSLSAAVGTPTSINLDAYFSGATAYQVYSGALPQGLSIVGNSIVGTATEATAVTCVIRAYNDYDTLDSGVVSFEVEAGASDVQTHSTGGTATAIASATAVTVAVNAQSQSTAGQASAIANAVATITAANEQSQAASGTAQTIGTAQATTVPVNAQAQTTSGSTQSLAQLIAQSQIVNAQAISTGGITTAIGYGIAETTAVNETGNVQQASSGGTVIAVGTSIAVTSVVNAQQQQTSGTATATSSATADTISVHEQRHIADGTVAAIGYAIAVTTWFDGTQQSLVDTVFIKTSSKTIQSIKTSGQTMHHLRTNSRRSYQIKTSSEG